MNEKEVYDWGWLKTAGRTVGCAIRDLWLIPFCIFVAIVFVVTVRACTTEVRSAEIDQHAYDKIANKQIMYKSELYNNKVIEFMYYGKITIAEHSKLAALEQRVRVEQAKAKLTLEE